MAVKNSLTKQGDPKKAFSQFLAQPSVKSKIIDMIGGKDSQRFITSIISAVGANPALKDCDQWSLVSAALLGESLKLSPSPQLGQYYMVPYDQKPKYDKEGNVIREAKKLAQFQIGYKGYIQLAEKSGQYKKLNVVSIKEGELVRFDPLNEEIEVNLIDDEEVRENTPTIGYYAMFEYINGFRKAIYWSKNKMLRHADKYSAAFSLNAVSTQKFKKVSFADYEHGNYPKNDEWKYSSYWYKDFDGMAHKTMLRQLISKWGIMSIDMQTAIEKDMVVIDEKGDTEYIDNPEYEDAEVVEYEEAAMTEHEESDDAQMTILPDESEDEVFSEDDFFNKEV